MSDNLIVSSTVIRGGEPCIAGTRFPVWQIQDMHDAGRDMAYMLDEYPALRGHEAGIAAALAYPRRREADVFCDPETGSALEVRESWTPGYVEIVRWVDAMWDTDTTFAVEREHLSALIAALEHARGWEPAP